MKYKQGIATAVEIEYLSDMYTILKKAFKKVDNMKQLIFSGRKDMRIAAGRFVITWGMMEVKAEGGNGTVITNINNELYTRMKETKHDQMYMSMAINEVR